MRRHRLSNTRYPKPERVVLELQGYSRRTPL